MSARGGREAPNNKSSSAGGDVKADNNRSSAAGGDRDAFSNMINSAGGDSEVVNNRRCSSVGWAERLLQDLRFERGREALSTAVVVVLEGPGKLLTMMQAAVLGGGGVREVVNWADAAVNNVQEQQWLLRTVASVLEIPWKSHRGQGDY